MSLTPTLCSVHTHSALCDGKGTLAEMAAAAYAAGVRFFGASGHSHTPIPGDAGNVLPEDPAEYRRQVLALRAEYEGRMEVLLGIEQDSCSAQSVPDWADYWIGSVHHLRDPETGAVLLGDMAISLERCAAQGEEFGHGFGREVMYLTVHSVLHLLGYDHVDEGEMKRAMRAREEAIMARLRGGPATESE